MKVQDLNQEEAKMLFHLGFDLQIPEEELNIYYGELVTHPDLCPHCKWRSGSLSSGRELRKERRECEPHETGRVGVKLVGEKASRSTGWGLPLL